MKHKIGEIVTSKFNGDRYLIISEPELREVYRTIRIGASTVRTTMLFENEIQAQVIPAGLSSPAVPQSPPAPADTSPGVEQANSIRPSNHLTPPPEFPFSDAPEPALSKCVKCGRELIETALTKRRGGERWCIECLARRVKKAEAEHKD